MTVLSTHVQKGATKSLTWMQLERVVAGFVGGLDTRSAGKGRSEDDIQVWG